jgi:hypothetical protein
MIAFTFTTGVILKELILAFSGFAVGAFAHLGYRSIRSAIRAKDHRTRSGFIGLAVGRVGIIPPLALIAEIVYHAVEIPPTWRAIVYLVSLACVAGGYAWALRHHVVQG